jgi:hypothetical protein
MIRLADRTYQQAMRTHSAFDGVDALHGGASQRLIATARRFDARGNCVK